MPQRRGEVETESDDEPLSPAFIHTTSNVTSRSLEFESLEQARSAGPSGAAAGAPAGDAASGPALPPRRRRRRRGFGLSGVVNTLVLGLGSWGAYCGWQSKNIRLSIEFGAGLAWGLWTGLAYVKSYRRMRRAKDMLRCGLAATMDKRRLKEMSKGAAYWVSFEGEEKAECMNTMIKQMWPFYERAICKQVVATVEPLLQRFKPPFVSSIKFRKLTFGDMPFKFTHMKVIREAEDEIVLEAGVRWGGEAHVAIGVDLIGGAFISPSVRRLNFFAMTRITLTRFVPTIPCFGAVLVSLQRAPMVTFDINCGPGVGNAIEAWLKPFLTNNILGNLLVWPNRIVVPLLPEEVIGPYDTLNLTTKGILRVRVISASNLMKADVIGKGDPFAVLETVPLQPAKTKVIKNTDSPFWDEEKFLKVQEIEQILRVEVRDWESPLNSALTFQTSELQGRCIIPIADLPLGQMVDAEYDLGFGEWGQEGGPGSGYGTIHLQLTYLSLTELRSDRVAISTSGKEEEEEEMFKGIQRGLVFILVERGHNLMSVDGGPGKSDPYCVIWLGGVKKTTEFRKDTADPVWNENMDWPNISAKDTLYLEVYDKGKISDKLLGRAKIDMCIVALEFAKDDVRRPIKTNMSLEGGNGDVVLFMEWVPLDHNPIPRPRSILRTPTGLFGELERGVLYARLVRAKNLRNVDAIGVSDPYCLMKIGGNEKKSKIISNNLNPVWNETFLWVGCSVKDTLNVFVKDDGPFKDTVLGRFDVPLANAVNPPAVVHTFDCSLFSKTRKRKAQGTVTVQLLYVLRTAKDKTPIPEEPEWPPVDGSTQ
ncbi:hypothetical protein BSKO_06044 [Bryopsis sp. KO-2023]|nr:hypothetical protein BSKO_06044 [Bryopsis sp. KO-2023]